MGFFDRPPQRPSPQEMERRVEIEREVLRHEIASMRAQAEDYERRFDELARGRAAIGHSDFLYHKKGVR